jgi:hypothetical protein
MSTVNVGSGGCLLGPRAGDEGADTTGIRSRSVLLGRTGATIRSIRRAADVARGVSRSGEDCRHLRHPQTTFLTRGPLEATPEHVRLRAASYWRHETAGRSSARCHGRCGFGRRRSRACPCTRANREIGSSTAPDPAVDRHAGRRMSATGHAVGYRRRLPSLWAASSPRQQSCCGDAGGWPHSVS